MASSAMLRRVALVRTNVSEELSASIIRVTRRPPVEHVTICLVHYATSQKVSGPASNDVTGVFGWLSPSSHHLALEWTETTQMGSRNLPGVKGGRQLRLTTICEPLS
jgi:hypothetical protein